MPRRKHLSLSGDRVVDIHFTETNTRTSMGDVEDYAKRRKMEPSEPSCTTSGATSDAENHAEESVPEPAKDAETQTEEFAYMIYKQTYQAPER